MTVDDIYTSFVNLLTRQIEEGILPAHLKDVRLQPDMRLEELALDSISEVGLLASLMDETDRYFPASLFSGNPTLKEVAERACAESVS